VNLRQRPRVGGEAEEQAVPEGQQARVAEEEVERESGQRKQRDFGREAFGHADRAHGERQRDERNAEDPQRPRLPEETAGRPKFT
jgi:hypothetical protein